VTLPPVTFSAIDLANRLNPNSSYPALDRERIAAITTETGSVISVNYGQPGPCSATSLPAPASNATSCFPVYWQQFAPPDPDWFIKYAVTSVSQTDPSGGSPGTYTSYQYAGPAWHYDDNEVVEAKYRTYGQWRGFQDVKTFTGTGADAQTVSRSETRPRAVSWGFAAGSGASLGPSRDAVVHRLPLGEVPVRPAGGACPI